MTMPKFEPVAHMQVSVEEGIDTYFPRLHKPEKYNADWWRFDPLHSADQLTEAYEAGKREQAAELAAARAEIKRLKREDFREMHEMLRAMQAGELTVSRGLEILNIWWAGNWNDNMLPPVRQDLIEENAMPVEIIDRLNQQLAAEQAKNVRLRGALESAINGLTWWMDNMPHDVTEADYEEMDALQEALSISSDTSALESLIAKAGEVMRERCAAACAGPNKDWNIFADDAGHAIHALPSVTLEDLK